MYATTSVRSVDSREDGKVVMEQDAEMGTPTGYFALAPEQQLRLLLLQVPSLPCSVRCPCSLPPCSCRVLAPGSSLTPSHLSVLLLSPPHPP